VGSSTFTQLHIQCVFAVKYRRALIHPEWEVRLHQYITGMLQKRGYKMLAINGTGDHLHIFFGMRPHQALADLMREVKGESSAWINAQRLVPSLFRWQEGYGGFSYSRWDVQMICNYIYNQKEHHRKRSFLDEYNESLKEFEVEYDPQYIFVPPE
jgi:REP element-mobilizing transposase RayT